MKKKQAMTRNQMETILVATILSGCGHGFLLNTLTMFVKPVSAGLGFERGGFALYSSIATAFTVLALPLYGELFAKTSLRKLIICCSICCGMVFWGYSFCDRLSSFYALAACFGLFFNGVNLNAAANLINRRFSENKGFATGIAFAGSGVFAAAIVSVLAGIIETHGWRWGYRVTGLASMGMILPVVFFFLKEPAAGADSGSCAKVARTDGIEMARGEALRTVTLPALMLGGFLAAFVSQGIMANMVAALSDAGYASDIQGRVASLTMLTMGLCKILIGKLLDRFDGRMVIALFIGALFVSVMALLRVELPAMPYVAALAGGLGGSGCTVVLSCFTRDFFGLAEYSRIYALVNAASNMGTALGVSAPGIFFDRFESYQPAWKLFAILVAMGFLSFFTAFQTHLRRLRARENITGR